MAKFYDYAYHEDEFPEKKKLTNEDIDFLVNLQKEMNTQGHIAQADPRFWVISDKERINYVSEDEDGIEIYDSDNTNSLSLKEFATKLEEEILPEMYPDGYRFKTILHSDFNMVLSIYRIAPLAEIEENFPYIEDIIDFLNNRGYSFRINRYRERFVELAGNFFLTHKDAKEYLKRCSHHYSENAHTFAMTCESPEVQRLYKILHKTDFTALKALEQQSSKDCISREEALLALTGMDLPTDRDKLIALFTNRIQHLQPVTPERPKEDGVEDFIKHKIDYLEDLASIETNEGRWREEEKYLYAISVLEEVVEYMNTSGGEEDEDSN